jgi:hypothetical protein
MEPVSRRIFFKQAGAASALAAVAVAASGVVAGPLGLTSAGASTAKGSGSDAELTPNEHLRGNEDLVAHVKNSRSGEISLFIGHKEVTIHDRKVAASLLRAAR